VTPRFDFSPDFSPRTSSLDQASPSSLRLPTPHPAQATMIAESARFNVAACGRQIGKTTLGIERIARASSSGQPCAWFAPTYKFLDEVWRTLRTLLEPVTASKNEQQHHLDLRGGGSIDCWSLEDPDAGRGRRYKLLVVDEAAMVRELETVWQASLRPTLSVLEGGVWFLSTPKGLNYFHHLYQLGQDPLESEWRSWQMPSSRSPFIKPEELEAARRSLPERVYAQEYLAIFLEIAGAGVFRGVHDVARLEPQPPQRGHAYVFGVDVARTDDFTVISVLDATTAEQVALDRFADVDFETQLERLHRWANLYRPRAIVVEANSFGMPLVERLQTGYQTLLEWRPALPIVPFTTTNATKQVIVQHLALLIEDGRLTLLDEPVQTAELVAYEIERLPSGLLRYGAPVGQHDDTVMALALAAWGGTRDSASTTSSYAWSN